jgi:hypothetical protein
MIVRINALVDALNSPNTNIVTAVTSSNVTSGPLGGTYGVPMHYCTKDDGTHQYLFAMGIRPGSTTATFTIPSWAGQTITVLDESRTVTVDGAGVLTDSFPADYTVHLYQKIVTSNSNKEDRMPKKLNEYDTVLSQSDEMKFQKWKHKYAPRDSGYDYDLRGAYKSGFKPDPKTGHWDDKYKKPNHPTFSVYSKYAKDRPDLAGTWHGDTYIPPKKIRGTGGPR